MFKRLTVFLEKSHWLFVLAGIFIGLLIFPFLTYVNRNLIGFFENLIPEAFGIVFTVFVIDQLNERRLTAAEKRDWIAQLGSPDASVSRHAIKILWARGWLQDGSVRGANLWGANIESGDLGGADLQNINFWAANLRNTRLWSDLRGTNLHAADISGAELSNYRFGSATFDETTKLPDGKNWSPETDMGRFTNPQHTDFWRSDDKRSPAFRS